MHNHLKPLLYRSACVIDLYIYHAAIYTDILYNLVVVLF